ncbi:unnamed protein product, partial [Mesorhabditis belari]|uniref:MARVEL domain-containing protein n=1 Tax=Mesorhabditis belari TaxID=2138241 RepID=A0AAF3EV90_9BILA
MGDVRLNTGYIQSQRGLVKIFQIVFGFIVCCMLCAAWHGGRSCFAEFRVSFVSALCFVVTTINVVLFIMNFLNMGPTKLERIYSLVVSVFFFVGAILILWFIIDAYSSKVLLIFVFLFLLIQIGLYVYDLKLLHAQIGAK